MVSVLVAVYNAEKYLSRCLESIISQSVEDFELLLINDGSTDCSGDICDNYALQDSRIKVIHQNNQGIGKTREVAIKHATGEYILFVDPDDWIQSNMLEEMYAKAKALNADILISNFYYNGDDFEYISKQYHPDRTNNDLIKLIVSGDFHGAYWNKLIKSSVLKNENIIFPTLNFCEDQLVFIQLLLMNSKVCFIDKAYYHYYQHPKSETNNISENFIRDKLQPYHKLLADLVGDDKRLILTSYFFYYIWLVDFNLNPSTIAYLKPKHFKDIYHSFLSEERKLRILKHLKYPFALRLPILTKLLINKIGSKI